MGRGPPEGAGVTPTYQFPGETDGPHRHLLPKPLDYVESKFEGAARALPMPFQVRFASSPSGPEVRYRQKAALVRAFCVRNNFKLYGRHCLLRYIEGFFDVISPDINEHPDTQLHNTTIF